MDDELRVVGALTNPAADPGFLAMRRCELDEAQRFLLALNHHEEPLAAVVAAVRSLSGHRLPEPLLARVHHWERVVEVGEFGVESEIQDGILAEFVADSAAGDMRDVADVDPLEMRIPTISVGEQLVVDDRRHCRRLDPLLRIRMIPPCFAEARGQGLTHVGVAVATQTALAHGDNVLLCRDTRAVDEPVVTVYAEADARPQERQRRVGHFASDEWPHDRRLAVEDGPPDLHGCLVEAGIEIDHGLPLR